MPNNLCKQGRPIPTRGAIMPLFTEAVAPHCPHQWGWWIDVWVWYLIKPAQLHNRGTCLAPNTTLTQAHTLHTKITTGFVKRVTWPWHNTQQWVWLWSNCALFCLQKEIQQFHTAEFLRTVVEKMCFEMKTVEKRNEICLPPWMWHKMSISYCPGCKSPAVISVTVVGR